MRVVYLVYSIAGWVAFGLLMAFWAGYVVGGRRADRRRGFDVVALPTAKDDQPGAPKS